MVHIHGGGNFGGEAYHDADNLVARGVIVVTVAYRLGVLGFAGHPALTAEAGAPSGEYASLDQIQALHWVHDNIASFGGDPANVTLFGFSAGSFDVAALMASPLAQGLFAKVGIQGEHFQGLYPRPISDADALGIDVARTVNCTSAKDVPACLRAVPAASLVTAPRESDVAPRVGGAVLPQQPLDLLGQMHRHLPLLIGFDREEDIFFTHLDGVDEIGANQFDQYARYLAGPQYAAQIEALYPYSAYGSYKWAYVTMETDAARGCPTRRIAKLVSADAPVYRYLFTHVDVNNPELASWRSFHGIDEQFLWDQFADWGYTPDAGEQLLSDRMASYWTNFARTSDPNRSGLPAWPRYRQPDETAIVLDDPMGTISDYHVDQCTFIDSLPEVFPGPQR
jgi:para-nitrobenzyl esterase